VDKDMLDLTLKLGVAVNHSRWKEMIRSIGATVMNRLI